MTDAILAVKDLKRYFDTPQGTVRAVNGVSFSVRIGETFGLVGESGSGKSTVAYTIAGMHRPTEGEIVFKGRNISQIRNRSKSLRKEIRIVFQDPGSSLNPKRSIKQSLELPLKVHGIDGSDSNRRDRTERVIELLDMVELPADYAYKYPQALSGGQKQRVAIARALATEPSLVVLDEPTSSLDVSVQAKIMKLLTSLQEDSHFSYLFITHDLSLIRNVSSRVAVMYLGKLCEIAPTEKFFRKPLHPYARMLISSIQVISEVEEQLKPEQIMPKGEVPSSINIPSGCSFHLRCPKKMEICTQVDPQMMEVEPDHFVRCHLFSD
ncbi:MAG: ABC transporter ATP-binding protein [Candidatus Bipolaricaulia bacterium]